MRLIDADALLAEYDRVHVGPPGGARKLIEDAPTIEPEITQETAIEYLQSTGWMQQHDREMGLKERLADDSDSYDALAEQETKPLGYRDCANAMLLMWMDKVVTDGEYRRIMDKLNAFWGSGKDEINYCDEKD